jgi:hypothetical protein
MRSIDRIEITRSTFSAAEPWARPGGASGARLRDSSTGSPPRLETTCTPFHDGHRLIVLFSCRDDEIVSTYEERDQPLYEEDVVEIFLAPATLEEYFEIEVSPRGIVFDARVQSPDLERSTMRVDRRWDCAELFAGVRITRGESELFTVETVVVIPFASLEVDPPGPGAEWRGNFFRIDRSASHGDSFSAWQPTGRTPPDFHVPAAFGKLVFQ